jgi:type VI secretion system protein ImpK
LNPLDPFSALSGERTIIKPRLGKTGKTNTHAIDSIDNILGPVSQSKPMGQDSPQAAQSQLNQLLSQLKNCPPASKNILLIQTSHLLRLMCTVAEMADLPSPKLLSTTLSAGLLELDRSLELLQRPQAERLSVRYLLCTYMDERAANTPWGGAGQWASHSLLHQFFSETWGGEKVFALIQKMMQNPTDNRDLLGLMAVVLSLGLQGKYKVEPGGESALNQLRSRLFQLVSLNLNTGTRGLHPDLWQSKAPSPNHRFLQIPLWLPMSAMCLIGAIFFVGLYFDMNTQSDTVFNEIAAISFPQPEFTKPQVQPLPPAVGLELPSQLQQEIIGGQLTLKQSGNRSTVVLVGDGLFSSGSAELSPDALPLVDKVERELAQHPGQITVTGYTDNQPIRSIRFPSNWQLSAARADHVGQRIAIHLPNVAIATEGAGAANPIAPNDTSEGRALNRRVEITLLHAQ